MTLLRRMVAIAAVLTMGALLSPTTFATTIPVDANTVRLHMLSGSDSFRYTNGDGSIVATQTLAAKGCALKTSGASLIAFQTAPAGSTVGLSTDQLGVRTSGEGSSGKCAQVNIPDQVLTVKVDHTGVLGGHTFDFAELDIEAKYNATINIEIYYHGVQVDADPASPGLGYSKTCTQAGSDCGPDSADHDNFRIRIPAGPTGTETVGFDELRLWATSTDSQGSVALEGGRDGTPAWPGGLGSTIGTTDSIFHVADVLDCGDTKTASSGGLATVTITRLANSDGTTCVAKNYVLTTAEETPPGGTTTTNVVTFDQQSITGQEGAHYLMTIVWTYPPGTSENTNPSTVGGRTFQIDYGDGTPRDAQLCTAVTYDTDGNVTGATHPSDVGYPDGIPWCITGQSYTIDGSGNVVLIQSWDGLDDPKVW
jgi:hypothetical protein